MWLAVVCHSDGRPVEQTIFSYHFLTEIFNLFSVLFQSVSVCFPLPNSSQSFLCNPLISIWYSAWSVSSVELTNVFLLVALPLILHKRQNFKRDHCFCKLHFTIEKFSLYWYWTTFLNKSLFTVDRPVLKNER